MGFTLQPSVNKSAVISACEKYRYRLKRVWNDKLSTCYWIMLNPSTADAYEDDPTIRKCMSIAKMCGYGAIDVRNLFAFRATNPKELLKVKFPDGPNNDVWLDDLTLKDVVVIAAWGTKGTLNNRGKEVCKLFHSARKTLYCLGTTKNKQPKHPLYVPSYTPLIPFEV